MAEPTLPLSVHIGSTPLDRLLFNCPAHVTCAQLLQSVQSALPHATLSHLSTFHHDRIPIDAEMAQYVQAHDAVIAHFAGGPQQAPSRSAGVQAANNSGVRMVVAPSSAFTPAYGAPPSSHMHPHSAQFSPSHPPMPPPQFMMYGPPPPPSAYHPMPPPMQHSPHHLPAPSSFVAPTMHSQPIPQPLPPAASHGVISMVEACQLATQSVKPALERYRTTHASSSPSPSSSASILQSGNHHNHASTHSPTARALHHSRKRDDVPDHKRASKKRAFQRVSGDVEAETESEGVSDDESMGSASSWSAVDDEEDSRAAQAAQLIASLSQSPSGKRTPVVKLEHEAQSGSLGSRLLRSTSPPPSSVFDSLSLLKNKQLKHASVLVLYQAKEEQRPQQQQPASSPSSPASLAPLSPASSVHSMVLSPASSAQSSPATPSNRSVAHGSPSRVTSSFNPHNLTSSAIGVHPSSHATTSHAAQATVAIATSAASSAIPAAFMPASVSSRHRSRLGIPVMRERRRRRRRSGAALPVTAATTASIAMPGSSPAYSVAAAIPAMPVAAASPAKAVMAAISYVPNAATATAAYSQPQPQTAATAQAQQVGGSPVKERDEKRTYSGKVRVYHNVPINVRTGRVAVHG